PGRGDDVGQLGVVAGRREHGDLVTGGLQRLGKVAHVELDAPRGVEGVRADDADPQVAAPPGRAHPVAPPEARCRAGPRSATNTRCTMCQSCVRVTSVRGSWATQPRVSPRAGPA